MKREKIKAAIIGVFVVFIIIAIGWGALSLMIQSVGTYSDATISNTTAGLNTVNSVSNIGGIFLAILAILTIVLVLGYFSSSTNRYKKLGLILDFLVSSAYYFVFGLLALVIIVVPSYLLYLLYNYTVLDGHTGDILPLLQWVGIAVVAFFGIAIIGYGFKKKIIDKYVKIKEEIKTEKKVKEPKVN